jgi:hypothetical protein|tara:strand:+ start:800 stop:1168 length:369 start_codon:yes stop_codon:yes gene_type:complete
MLLFVLAKLRWAVIMAERRPRSSGLVAKSESAFAISVAGSFFAKVTGDGTQPVFIRSAKKCGINFFTGFFEVLIAFEPGKFLVNLKGFVYIIHGFDHRITVLNITVVKTGHYHFFYVKRNEF